MAYNEINTIRKEGRLDEALVRAEREFALQPDRATATALFWCLNDDAKRSDGDEAEALVERMRQLMADYAPDNEMMGKVLAIAEHMLKPEARLERQGWEVYQELRKLELGETALRKRYLFQYIKLELPKPSLLHSLIMGEALKMEKFNSHDFSFIKFSDLWGYDSWREEDWEPKNNKEGQRLPSNVERAISSCIREMHTSGLIPGEKFCLLLDKAIERYPKNNHLQRYAAQILAKQGRNSEAIEAYKQLIQKLPDKFYLWDDLAELTTDDPDLHMGLLCGAVTSGAHDEYLVNVRLQLADILCNKRMYSHAQTELDRYQRAHEYKGWPLKRKFYNVATRVPKGTKPADNRSLYAHYKAIADSYIYANLQSEIMVKVWEKQDSNGNRGAVAWLMRDDEGEIWFKPRAFHLDFRTPNGSVFEVKKCNGQIVWIKPTQLDGDLPWLKLVTGALVIRRPASGKTIGFVDDVFVPSQMLYSRQAGSLATVIAVKNDDKRWSALAIE